ncbi:MAG: AAA family ATPase [Prevotellaceae bacterium]|nr:AAA family ATPase [Prevotellaceae bacterium]
MQTSNQNDLLRQAERDLKEAAAQKAGESQDTASNEANSTKTVDERVYIDSTGHDIRKDELSQTARLAGVQPLLLQQETGVPILIRGGMTSVIGDSKVGKSTLCAALAAATLGHPQLGLAATRDDLRVIYFDTEQGKSEGGVTLMWKIKRLSGTADAQSNPRLRYIDLLDAEDERSGLLDSESLRRERIARWIKAERPDLAVVDGLIDLVPSMNDEVGSKRAICWLRKLCDRYQCAILLVLHTNMGTDQARGHIGRFLLQKGYSSLMVSGRDGRNIVKPHERGTRGEPFAPFAYTIRKTQDGLALPVACDKVETLSQAEETLKRYFDWARQAFSRKGADAMTRRELLDGIMDLGQKAEVTVDRKITTMVKEGMIVRKGQQYLLPPPDEDDGADAEDAVFEEIDDEEVDRMVDEFIESNVEGDEPVEFNL